MNALFAGKRHIIDDVITTPNPFPYTAKFMFVGVRHIIKLNKSDVEKDKYNTYIVLSYIKNI